ncbi:hypothetical protein A2U01_0005948 [Trifolium medium]|uniref:Uncharacterized protein n=1 Tax=Trifolium medium TaxID=97028 RepID=A0A392MCC6_9FABA|nr:hypothetical protein [Trifolium medium]
MEMETNLRRSGSLERYNFGSIWLFIPLTPSGWEVLGSAEGPRLVEERVLTGRSCGCEFGLVFGGAQSASKVGEMGSWAEGHWVWDLKWRRNLFIWELNLLKNLLEALNRSSISEADDDS